MAWRQRPGCPRCGAQTLVVSPLECHRFIGLPLGAPLTRLCCAWPACRDVRASRDKTAVDSNRGVEVDVANDEGLALAWPSAEFVDFEDACEAAISRGCPLKVAAGKRVYMRRAVALRKQRQRLEIFAEGAGCSIEACGHTAFTLAGRHAQLCLRNVHLCQTAESPTGDVKDSGAAIFLMGDTKAILQGSTVTSVNGLGIWMVQRAVLEARSSTLADCGRSGVAMFGDATARLHTCSVEQCAIHGACARGRARLTLDDCEVADCGRRGVYVYQSGTLNITRCVIRGTKDTTRAALEAAGAKEGDVVKLHATDCTVCDNYGAGVRLRGSVKFVLERCTSLHNKPDVHVQRGEENLALPVPSKPASGEFGVVEGPFEFDVKSSTGTPLTAS